MSVTEKSSPYNRPLHAGGQQEATKDVRGGGMGRGGNGVTSVWIVTVNSDVLQVPRTPAH